jgi:hypothetical protein
MSGRRIVLHIGTHRTGTTAIQQFLRDHPDDLATADVHFPIGTMLESNHVELPLLARRPERRSPLALTIAANAAWRQQLQDWIDTAVGSPTGTVVFSCENLSLLRYDDEIERLREMLGGDRRIEVVVFTREPGAFLASMARSMWVLQTRPSPDPDSDVYLEPDSWLVDYESRISLWERHADVVHALDYDTEVSAAGSVIPAIARLLGLRDADTASERVNSSASLGTAFREWREHAGGP